MNHFIETNHYHRPQHQAAESPTISSSMIKELPSTGRATDPLAHPLSFSFTSAIKRKRGDSIDEIEISASRREDEDDAAVVYPLHKRTGSATRLTASFCAVSYDSERRDGPEEEEDDEAEALAKRFRSSIYRREPVVSPLSASSPIRKHDADDEEDECGFYPDFPSIGRATTICDDSDLSTDGSCDPPDMASRSPSPQCEEPLDSEQVQCHEEELWSSSLSVETLETPRRENERPLLAPRQRPAWLSSRSVSEPTKPSPLWNTSSNKDAFWPSTWTGTFHQGSA